MGMAREGADFDAVLADAQRLGYAEANPSLDIDGFDTAHKICILASLAYGVSVPLADVKVEGIRGLDLVDVKYADELGYVIKLLEKSACNRGSPPACSNTTIRCNKIIFVFYYFIKKH